MITDAAAVVAFVAANAREEIPGADRGFGPCSAIGFVDDRGQLEAGFIYHNWNPESGVIEISAASSNRGWATKEKLRAVFEYPFSFCRLVVWRTGEGNMRVRRLLRSLGARETVVPELRSPTEAEIIFTLNADQWQSSKFAR